MQGAVLHRFPHFGSLASPLAHNGPSMISALSLTNAAWYKVVPVLWPAYSPTTPLLDQDGGAFYFDAIIKGPSTA